jgi:hypothetical protein
MLNVGALWTFYRETVFRCGVESGAARMARSAVRNAIYSVREGT